MKHTNFYPQLIEIKKKEYQELYQAIKAHGGEYSWGTEDEEGDWWFNLVDYPIVAVNTTGYTPQPMDICIRSVRIENDRIELEGEDNEFRNRIEFSTDDVFAGHLSYITDLIPATEQVSEVKAVPNEQRKIWMRAGGSEKEISYILDGKGNISILFQKGQFELNGESYIPETCIDEYNEEYGTGYKTMIYILKYEQKQKNQILETPN